MPERHARARHRRACYATQRSRRHAFCLPPFFPPFCSALALFRSCAFALRLTAPPAPRPLPSSPGAVGAQMFVFGGRTHGGRLPEGVRVLSLVSAEWSELCVEGSVPARYAHTMSAWRNMLVVFGGMRRRECLADVALLDTHNLCWLRAAPAADDADDAGTPGDKGGNGAPASQQQQQQQQQRRRSPSALRLGPPSARAYHSAALIQNRLFIFGGEDGGGLLPPHVHVLDLLRLAWAHYECDGQGARYRAVGWVRFGEGGVAGQSRAGQGRAGQGRAGQGKAVDGRAGQGRAGQGRVGQGRAGQGRAVDGRAGQGRAGQGRAGQGKAGQGRAGQGKAGQCRGGQGTITARAHGAMASHDPRAPRELRAPRCLP